MGTKNSADKKKQNEAMLTSSPLLYGTFFQPSTCDENNWNKTGLALLFFVPTEVFVPREYGVRDARRSRSTPRF